MRKIYYIDIDREKQNHAGVKAPDDLAAIFHQRGYKRIVFPDFPQNKNWLYQRVWLVIVGIINWTKVLRNVNADDVVIFQHPIYGQRMSEKMIPIIKKKKSCKFIGFIHDLESLRGGIQGVYTLSEKNSQIGDNLLLRHFDVLICHNENMNNYLVSQGFDVHKLVNLEIFDYLSDYKCEKTEKNETPSIAIAGNLAKGKCGYIYDICSKENNKNASLEIHLFGGNYDKENGNENMVWHGSFKPEELPQYLKGDFGLVWDGTSIEACIGNTGEYLKYNNPHKLSLYLSSGLPVIVWKQSAMAKFVLKYNVGITVENLKELDTIISRISKEEYTHMCQSVAKVSEKLQQGYFSKKAIDKALYILE